MVAKQTSSTGGKEQMANKHFNIKIWLMVISRPMGSSAPTVKNFPYTLSDFSLMIYNYIRLVCSRARRNTGWLLSFFYYIIRSVNIYIIHSCPNIWPVKKYPSATPP